MCMEGHGQKFSSQIQSKRVMLELKSIKNTLSQKPSWTEE